ncbi:lactate utilization protein [uncultured Treponema sp.]|uniref:lactate utilization protein n=1 Tax=uncultured Treponema sp. TaxID=162155 RepID=UPI0025FA7C34|nr:lactate utilization protein [uncultured Treponema sp.]
MDTEKIIANLKKRGFEAVFAQTKAEAVEAALAFMPKGSSVSWGGSVSVEESGLLARVKNGDYKLIDRDSAKSPEEKAELMRKAFFADFFLTSFNAVSEDGVLFNIDGNGNRVAAITFGPKEVIALVGINKIVPTEADLENRALKVAAPKNAQRLKLTNEHDICATFVKTRISRTKGRIKIILVGEELGY